MKKWNNPELQNLSIQETKNDDVPRSPHPIPDWDCSTEFDINDRTTCKYWKVNGCSHNDWGTGLFSQFSWPCPKATTIPPVPVS